jgi:hypothetical protein
MFSYLQRQVFGLPSGIKMAAPQAALDLYVTVETNEALQLGM